VEIVGPEPGPKHAGYSVALGARMQRKNVTQSLGSSQGVGSRNLHNPRRSLPLVAVAAWLILIYTFDEMICQSVQAWPRSRDIIICFPLGLYSEAPRHLQESLVLAPRLQLGQ